METLTAGKAPALVLAAVPGQDLQNVRPLAVLTAVVSRPGIITVADGAGREYVRAAVDSGLAFAAGGAAGTHTATLYAEGELCGQVTFTLNAVTEIIDDGGRYQEFLEILRRTIFILGEGDAHTIHLDGRDYPCFVPWILDHSHTAKGGQYFAPWAQGLADLERRTQRADGMVWSFYYPGDDFHYSAYHPRGYAERIGNCVFGRQPVENHNEYNYVDCCYTVWQSSGDDVWLREIVPSCMKALDYTVNSPVRWSEKFQLLKRGFTIDSWDFQPEDEYLAPCELGVLQQIDPERTKFGVFFGDNQGYADSCDKLAKMLDYLQQNKEAAVYRERAAGIRERLDKLVWNGCFYRQREEEDPAVKRDFGIDLDSQIVMSNAYALNRGITSEKAAAIIKEYQRLRDEEAPRHCSPGEWYAIYPPYPENSHKGFGRDSRKWQYMNGGVHGHAAGELARGAFAHGFESYGADILERVRLLGKKYGKVMFAYTGGYDPEPPAPESVPADLTAAANMSLSVPAPDSPDGRPLYPWLCSGPGYDLENLPVGEQTCRGINFRIIKPEENGGRVAAAIAAGGALPSCLEIPVGRRGAAVHLVHTFADNHGAAEAAVLSFHYQDGSRSAPIGVRIGKDIANWWFVHLQESAAAGVFWKGNNAKCTGMGVCRAQIINPCPEKEIAFIRFDAVYDGTVYALLALSAADRPLTDPIPALSTGGPDNWAGGLCMAALIEGLAGVHDDLCAFREVTLSLRWVVAGVDKVRSVVRYAAGTGYVAYDLTFDREKKELRGVFTGSPERARLRWLLPEGFTQVSGVAIDGQATSFTMEKVGNSLYAAVDAGALAAPKTVNVSLQS